MQEPACVKTFREEKKRIKQPHPLPLMANARDSQSNLNKHAEGELINNLR